MPIYMDRHDIPGATAEAVAAAHQHDVKVQAKHNCRALTYWFDEQRGTAFCLVEGPNEGAVRAMHREAHGLIPNMITEVEPSTVASFLGRVTDPEGAATPIREAGFRALMFTDMASSTRITNALGDVNAKAVMTKHNDIVRHALLVHGGREVDRAGDGFLTCFDSASQAVACAATIQRSFRDYNAGGTLPVALRVRIGLGAGEPLTDGEALFGSTVNLTSRICALAAPAQILAARVVRDLCAGKGLTFRRFGEVSLEGFADPVELHEVGWT